MVTTNNLNLIYNFSTGFCENSIYVNPKFYLKKTIKRYDVSTSYNNINFHVIYFKIDNIPKASSNIFFNLYVQWIQKFDDRILRVNASYYN